MIKEPFFTEEERKDTFEYTADWYKFETRIDLSGGIKVKPIYEDGDIGYNYPSKLVARDVAIFIAHFMLSIFPRLNGFSGFGAVEWEFLEKEYEIEDEYVDDPNQPWNYRKTKEEIEK